jgi:creatinine amidohydrolase
MSDHIRDKAPEPKQAEDDTRPGASPAPAEPGAAFLRFEELSTPQLEKIDKKRAVVLLPIGPLEEHGPHLPFGVDAFNADFVAEKVAGMLKQIDASLTVVKLPVLFLGTHVYRFGGTLWVRQRVVRNTMIDYGRSLATFGFEKMIIVSAHGGPRHFVALEEAARMVSRRQGVHMISLTSRIIVDFLLGRYVETISRQMPTPLSEEDRRTLAMDYHAGWWETSMMLWHKPHLVDRMYRHLPPSLVPRRKLRLNSAQTAGPALGYLGAPAKASAEFAEASTEALQPDIMRILAELLNGRVNRKAVTSPLYYMPIFRTNWKYWLFAAGAIVAGLGIWLLSYRG